MNVVLYVYIVQIGHSRLYTSSSETSSQTPSFFVANLQKRYVAEYCVITHQTTNIPECEKESHE